MSHRSLKSLAIGLLSLIPLASVGCTTSGGPYLGVFAVPIPVSPYFQEKAEDKFWEHERYDRVPILGPITSGPTPALDPPSPDEIIRALESANPVEGGLPFLHEVQRNNVQIRTDLIEDYVDPPRFYPLIGPAQLHHAHYKCTISYSQTKRIGWPYPHSLKDEEVVEVVYIDHNHLHMVGNIDPGMASNY